MLFLFQQSGFAQVASQLDISCHLAGLRNAFVSDVFRPLHLRYLSYNPIDNIFRLFLDKGSHKNPNPQELEDATKTLLNYFFIGVTLPNDTFWVNLRPDAEDNIIDDRLAQTDVGRILLESDLQLKKDTAKFTSPKTPEGKEYWDKLYKKAGEIFGSENITIPTLTRPWIVPDEIIIRETTDSAYIYKATLKVMLEEDYLNNRGTLSDNNGTAQRPSPTVSINYEFNDPRLKELNRYSTELIREIIIPKLTQEINASKRYAQLRQVYYSLIMAQWFKARFANRDGVYSRIVDRRVVFPALYSKESWSKTTYFQAYQKSFKDGEYNIQEPVYTLYGQTIRSYFSGGEALTDMHFISVPSANQFLYRRHYLIDTSFRKSSSPINISKTDEANANLIQEAKEQTKKARRKARIINSRAYKITMKIQERFEKLMPRGSKRKSIFRIDRDLDKYYGHIASVAERPTRVIDNLLLENPNRVIRVLDIGCGEGNFLKDIGRIYSKEIEEERIELYGITLVKYGDGDEKGINILEGRMEDLPFEDTFFDYIISVQAMQYSYDPLLAIEEACRVLKIGGSAVLFLNNPNKVLQKVTVSGREVINLGQYDDRPKDVEGATRNIRAEKFLPDAEDGEPLVITLQKEYGENIFFPLERKLSIRRPIGRDGKVREVVYYPLNQHTASSILTFNLPLVESAGSSIKTAMPKTSLKDSMPPGGIDFRSLPIVTRAVTNLSANIGPSAINNLISINLNEEWLQIGKMASSGITPFSERIKEYVQASCVQDNIRFFR